MRKKQAKKRPLLPDPKFNDQLVTRFVNNLMWDGKKSTAFKIFYDAIDIIEERKQDDEKSMALKLANEVLSASKEEGAAVKKRQDTHKMAEANKAFSHFRF